jgi:hypothetical protein
MQHRRRSAASIWPCSTDMDIEQRHGHAAGTWTWNMYIGIDIDIDMEYGHGRWLGHGHGGGHYWTGKLDRKYAIVHNYVHIYTGCSLSLLKSPPYIHRQGVKFYAPTVHAQSLCLRPTSNYGYYRTRCPAEQSELRLYLAAGSSARLRD